MKQIIFISIFILFFVLYVKSQSYAPPQGFEGTTAISKDSSIFIDWAKDVEISRGFADIAFPENGYVDYGIEKNAIGKASGNLNVVSLGDGGSIVLTFNSPITNGKGYDFAVFENGFFKNVTSELAFLELAFVEVSTDGIAYVRFPAVSEIQTETQIGSFENINARYIHNFAGKYTMYFGTPFDLEDLVDITIGTSVNLNEINYIKIIDVVGSIDDEFVSYDNERNRVNDPYPTAFTSGGFDLDAVGVINNVQNANFEGELLINPNPVKDFLAFRTDISDVEKIEIFSIEGKLLISTREMSGINVNYLETGVYILKVWGKERSSSALFVK